MTFSPFSRLSFTASSRMTTAVVGISLTAVATAIYLSPEGTRHAGQAAGASVRQLVGTHSASPLPSDQASASQSPSTPGGAQPTSPNASKPDPTPTPGRTPAQLDVIHLPGQTHVVVLHTQTTRTVTSSPSASPTPTPTPTGPAALRHCSNFHWQQDAQAAYLANLSDPGALDGAIGPHNGDGIACNSLPVDPSRPASTPADAYQAPEVTAAAKAELVQPTAKYFGIAQNGLPGDSAMYDRLARQAGKAPSSVGWFSGFDSNFGADQVRAAWSHGALPMITWMSVALDPTSGHSSSEFTLSKIVDGSLDGYLSKYAGDIVRANLPVVIRFDHEMNGNWYSWSAGMYGNTPARYVAAWQHIWNLFQNIGANDDVIWLWSVSRIDTLKPHATSGGGVGQTTPAEDYPGDKYVDWVGGSIYLRTAKTGPTYAATFGKTVAALEGLCSKPVYIPETAAVETDSTTGTDLAELKSQWISNAITGFLADPRIIGFSWFNNPATTMVNGVPAYNDWRIDSSDAALHAFQQGVAASQFSSGTLPDGTLA